MDRLLHGTPVTHFFLDTLIDQYVGLEEIDDGQWDVYFGPLRLGRLHENLMTIEPTFDSISSRV